MSYLNNVAVFVYNAHRLYTFSRSITSVSEDNIRKIIKCSLFYEVSRAFNTQ